MSKIALFALMGTVCLAYWWSGQPSFEGSPTRTEWVHVLAFSGVILGLAAAILGFGQIVDGSAAHRLTWLAATGAVLASAANLLEDGLRIDAAFYAFIVGTLVMYVGLLALGISILRRGRDRELALVPAGTIVGVSLFALAGGPVLFATWLVAAVLAFRCRSRLAPV